MLRTLLSIIAAGLSLAFSASLLAQAPKPLVVVSLSSHDTARSSTESVNYVNQARDLPTWLSSMLSLYTQGMGVGGLDRSRPWGVVVQRGEKLSAYGFLPIASLEDLASELSSYISSTTEVGNGMYKVIGTEAGKELYAREVNGWLFVSDSTECLELVPADPKSLLEGLDSRYEIGMRLALKNVPARMGNDILAQLDKAFGPALRQRTSEQFVEILGKAAFALDEMTLGWDKR